MTLYLQNGSYSYSASISAQHQYDHTSGTVLVLGQPVSKEITFNNRLHGVNFVLEQGKFQGQWSVTINGTSYASTSSSILLDLENGVYQYEVTAPAGYVVTPSTGTFAVLDGNVTIPLSLKTKTYSVTFVGHGIESGVPWIVELENNSINSNRLEISFEVPAGNYSYYVHNITQYATELSVGYVLVSDQNVTVDVMFKGPVNHPNEVVYVLIGAAAFGTITAVAVSVAGRKK